MMTVTVSSKYQVVIPKQVRDKLGIKAGQKFHVIQYEDRLEFIPLKQITEMRGFIKGIDTTVTREEDRI